MRRCATYRRAWGGSLVTQVEAAVKVDISVVSMEQEEQGRETSLEGRAALTHCHLTTVGRTPGEKKAQVVGLWWWHITTCLLWHKQTSAEAEEWNLLVLNEEVSHGVIRAGGVRGVAVVQNDHKPWVSFPYRYSYIQGRAHWQGDWACWVTLCVVGVSEQGHGDVGWWTHTWNGTFKPGKKT